MAAEEVVLGVVTTGAESDLQTATGIARQMFGRWGMSEMIGPMQVYPREGDPRSAGASDALLKAVDDEVRALLTECYEEAKRLLREHADQHKALVDALLEQETLDEADAYRIAGIEREATNGTHTAPSTATRSAVSVSEAVATLAPQPASWLSVAQPGSPVAENDELGRDDNSATPPVSSGGSFPLQ